MTDKERLDAIESGFCISGNIIDGVEHWLCMYSPFEPPVAAPTMRECIDHAILMRDAKVC